MTLHSCSCQSACFSEVGDDKLTLLMLPVIEETRTTQKAYIHKYDTAAFVTIEDCPLLRF